MNSILSEEIRLHSHHIKSLLLVALVLVVAGHLYNCCTGDAYPDPYEYGLYATETVDGKQMRWTWKRACLRTEADTDILSFSLYAAPHNIGEDGLDVKIFLDDQLLDRVHFVETGHKGVSYHVPRMTGEDISLKMEVNRTFNPHSQGISTDVKKNREQGVAIGPVTFLRIMPPGVKHVTMRD